MDKGCARPCAEEQEKRSKWMSECQRMAQNAINLASEATRALTISDWSHQDCEEFLDDLEREFKRVNKALDTHSPMDCEPGVKRRMADGKMARTVDTPTSTGHSRSTPSSAGGGTSSRTCTTRQLRRGSW
jgi:hypothetical protein